MLVDLKLVAHKHTFLIEGSCGAEYAVQLFHNGQFDPLCPCPATKRCCHFMSVMISIGMHHDSTYTISKEKKNDEQPNIALTIRKTRSGYRTPRKRIGGKPKTQPRRELSLNLASS